MAVVFETRRASLVYVDAANWIVRALKNAGAADGEIGVAIAVDVTRPKSSAEAGVHRGDGTVDARVLACIDDKAHGAPVEDEDAAGKSLAADRRVRGADRDVSVSVAIDVTESDDRSAERTSNLSASGR